MTEAPCTREMGFQHWESGDAIAGGGRSKVVPSRMDSIHDWEGEKQWGQAFSFLSIRLKHAGGAGSRWRMLDKPAFAMRLTSSGVYVEVVVGQNSRRKEAGGALGSWLVYPAGEEQRRKWDGRVVGLSSESWHRQRRSFRSHASQSLLVRRIEAARRHDANRRDRVFAMRSQVPRIPTSHAGLARWPRRLRTDS